MVDALSTAKLVIYIFLSIPASYINLKHGRRGFLGWFYVQLFCALRLVTDVLTIKPGLASTETTMILSSVGLAPLLFACAGILHEARLARDPTINGKKEWMYQIYYHILVLGATILNVVGVVELMEKGPNSVSGTLTKVGATLAVLGWVVLVGFSLFSLRYNVIKKTSTYRNGTLLLYGVIATLPFNGIRLVYSVISIILRVEHPHSEFLSSTAVEVCISVVPEMLVVIILIMAGLKTRELNQLFKTMNF
ncbi:hypothetical protein N7462_011405 [Penicillium macrosclerotiorum]|uniref:uncharacterized protein n=1 Tax=Penicillium macrosclerotiorum TaxID=303699 RepID=UPI0025487044|nr:uncharacterized protein N7462_011405 [Penicillium macrosclerotiorum]KAJ5664592.1 hypothetical protein N7462_011405 [Penicillium macrosclerotiorum]